MHRLSSLTPVVLTGALALAAPALAQPPQPGGPVARACHDHTELAVMLEQKFAEQRAALGLQSDGRLVEVFVAEDGTSWTIVVTRPDGWSCIVAVGENWESLQAITGPLA